MQVGSRGLPKSLLSYVTGYNEKYGFHDTALNRSMSQCLCRQRVRTDDM